MKKLERIPSLLEPWQEPVRGGYPDIAMLGLSGLEQLRAGITGHRPRPPLGHLTGLQLIELTTGSAVVEMPLTEWLCGSSGSISIGALALPADVALACAVQTTLPPATLMTTTELSLRLLAQARPDTSVIARGRLVHAKGTVALSEASLTDAHGRLLAHGTSLCFVPPPLSPAPDPPAALEPFVGPTYETPDPWKRELDGELPVPPIGRLTGLRSAAADEGAATFLLPATEWLSIAPRGRINGGVIALLAETALTAAIGGAAPAVTAVESVDIKVNYLRPLAADGRDALARATVVHTGRRRAIANVEVRDADDRLVALATGSAVLSPSA
jgi:uncharacterized protein (TIGR00369 family)